MDNEEFQFPNKIRSFADEDDFEDLFGEPVGTPERRAINTDEHGRVVRPPDSPVKSTRLVAQKKNLLNSIRKKRCSDEL